MKKIKRYALRITGGVFLLFFLIWITAYLLIRSNADNIRDLAIRQINSQVKGTVTIGSVSPDFLKSFPGIAIRLEDLNIRDSLWDQHHHNFLSAEKIILGFHFVSLLKGKPAISKILVDQGEIYLYTDECGYCNLNRREDISFNSEKSDLPKFIFSNSRFVIKNESVNSYHDIEVDHLKCTNSRKRKGTLLKVDLDALVHSIGFNMDKGSYLKEKYLEGTFHMIWYEGKKVDLTKVRLNIDDQDFTLSGTFFTSTNPMSYDLAIQTQKIPYPKAVGLLTESLQQNFELIQFLQPVTTEATIAGKMARKVVPRVTTHFTVYDADMETPLGLIRDCSYTGSFSNQVDSTLLPGDPNSKFIFNQFRGIFSNIPLASSQIEIDNLSNPYLKCDLQSEFDLIELNTLTESNTLRFLKGKGHLDVAYCGSMVQNDTLSPSLNGTFSLMETELEYIPRNLVFKDCSGNLEFKNKDIYITRFLATAGSTQLNMDGHVNNLMAVLNLDPKKLTMEWNISTPELNLQDFITYVVSGTGVRQTKKTKDNKFIKTAENVDRMLQEGTAKLTVTADRLKYKKFVATQLNASLILEENKALLKDVRLKHAGGDLNLRGTLAHESHFNALKIESEITNMDIPVLFRAFDNFGQDAITSANMRGQISAKINIEGILTDKAEILEKSMKGRVDFMVREGELVHFEPVEKLAATAFKKRDFSYIRFGELENQLDIDGSAITIHKMEIRSNVVVLFVEGIYDSKKGTDMSIQVPISNLSRVENEDLTNTGRAGANIRLRAKTGDDGKLNITWDPFNSAARKRK